MQSEPVANRNPNVASVPDLLRNPGSQSVPSKIRKPKVISEPRSTRNPIKASVPIITRNPVKESNIHGQARDGKTVALARETFNIRRDFKWDYLTMSQL